MEARRVLDSTVVFNEVMYHPAGGDETLEWIELHNQMAVDMNLSGWRLGDAVDYTFPNGTILGGGQYLVVAASPSALEAAHGVTGAFGPFQRRLSNAGDRIELRNHTGRLMDTLEYGDTGDWPAGADGVGSSLAKLGPQRATAPAENWAASVRVGGTPGAPNFAESPDVRDALWLSEVTAGGNGFWLEIQNRSDQPVSLTGLRIAAAERFDTPYSFPAQTLDPGAYVVVNAAQLGYVPAAGERLALLSADGSQLIDAVPIGERPQARSLAHEGRWQFPSQPTPSAANAFVFHDEIVINEVMYQARPTYATSAVYGSESVLPLDALWRYDQSGADPGAGWYDPAFDDSQWLEGQGLFYQENSPLPGPKNTTLELGALAYYFRTSFQWDGSTENVEVQLRHVIDDGAVFYLNGVEFERFNMPSGEITSSTPASSAISNATMKSVTLPSDLLRSGANVLAVQVHQNLAVSPDVVFGAELVVQHELVPSTPYRESDEEWIELYNRSDRPVDLSGWSIQDAVEFVFPEGTVLGPDEYLLVASDPADLAARHPGVRIAGRFSGRLSNSNERILLLDADQNLADEVHYYDGGRWPEFADGGGSSLELRDPHADNSRGEAWASSDETGRSTWKHYTYTRTVQPVVQDPPINFHEFVLGLIGPGEVLLDNISVIESPGVENVQLIQNGSFDADTVGAHADKWRLVGTHGKSEVTVDPDNPGNQVLRLVAEARMNYLSNHAETTLAGGARVVDGRTYEISFDAKWIHGTPQLHTELYYKDAARTTILEQPTVSGTPGARNSTWQANLGPTYAGLRHDPLIPTPADSVTVSVEVDDPDGLAQVDLYYAIDGVAPFTVVPMMPGPDGRYRATIPPAERRDVVQFYVQATDAQGAVTMFPTAGPDSRALYKVESSVNLDPLRHDFRLIMTPADSRMLHDRTKMVDNDRRGGTVVYNNEEVFYDVGGRLKGSMFSRQNSTSTGYNIRFNPDQLFRGVHDTVRFDQNGESELLVKYFTAAIGNPGGSYDDVMQLTTPSGQGGGPTLAYLAAHDDLFLSEQFENGQDGTLFKFEGIRVMQTTVDGNPESLKVYQPIGWVGGFDLQDLGDDKELYRWPFLIHNNRDRDDYTPLIALAKAFSLEGESLEQAVGELIDVEQWMSTFAIMSLFGIGDAYSQGNPHNLNLYVRPEDGKILAFPWDWDFVFNQSPTAPLHGGSNIGKYIDLPSVEHVFLGQLHHMITTLFNREAMSHWTDNFGRLLGSSLQGLLNNIDQRGNFVMSRMPAEVRFQIGNDEPNVNEQIIVDASSAVELLIPSAENGAEQLASAWIQPDFQPSDDWQSGTAGVGFQITPGDFTESITFDVSPMYGSASSAYIRIPFQFDGDAAQVDRLKLRMKYDDGFVAYLNGQPVAAANAPAQPAWDARATTSHRNSEAVQFVEFNITEYISHLRPGQNVLAIHGMNLSNTSNDFLIVPQLVVESFPEITPKEATVDADSILLEGRGWVNVREIRVDGWAEPLEVRWSDATTWAATVPLQPGENRLLLQAIDYSGQIVGADLINVTSTVTRPVLDHLRIAEFMYHSADPTPAERAAGYDDDDAFDFIELVNTSTAVSLELEGVELQGGVQFRFEPLQLAPGERVVVVDNIAAFRQRYGDDIAVAGQYTGSLNNGGESLRLHDAAGTQIMAVDYSDDDPWPSRADGDGASLELVDLAADVSSEFDRFDRWRASFDFRGSPGRQGMEFPGIVISEVLANSGGAAGLIDAIELYNAGDREVDLSGWYLSDSINQLRKYPLPAGTVLAPGAYLVLDERNFNPNPSNPGPNDFALSADNGDDVWLVVPSPDGGISSFVDDVHFGASSDGVSFGRIPDASGRLVPQSARTLGSPNSDALLGAVVISEIQHAPGPPSAAALAIDPTITSADLAYIELYNASAETVDLFGWQLTGGTGFRFGSGVQLDPGATLLITAFDPAMTGGAARLEAFRAHYGLGDQPIAVQGPYQGALRPYGTLLQWLQPDPTSSGPAALRPLVLADEVLYDNRSPWPETAAAQTLTRRAPATHGNTAASWVAAEATPGSVAAPSADFNGDGQLNALDIDLLCAAVLAEEPAVDLRFDLNGDQDVDQTDYRFLIDRILRVSPGDTNLDGVFNSSDLDLAFQSGKYEDGVVGNTSWSEGDWNCDGEFTTADLVAAFQSGRYSAGA